MTERVKTNLAVNIRLGDIFKNFSDIDNKIKMTTLSVIQCY